MIDRRTFLSTLAALAAPGIARGADGSASGYPDKPVHLIVMNAPGTATDNLARFVASHMARQWGSPVVVENKLGGGGTIGTNYVAKAPADGATVLFTNAAHYIFPSLYRNLPYDAAADFTPVAKVGHTPSLLLLPADSPYATVRDVIAAAKAHPGKLSFSSSGTGASPHLAGALFNSMAGVDIQHVPYKSAAQAILDVASKQVDMGFNGVTGPLPLIRDGRIRALAVTSPKRSRLLPDVPTIAEAALPGYAIETAVFALVRAGTPEPVVRKLADAMTAAARSAEFNELCAANGIDIDIVGPAGMKAAMPGEFAKYRKLVALAGIKAE
ncbi:Bug family tripartite tricarboxylate transporter substrate binding protein [Bordetella bronchiseptica]|uniref:Bug family tripartite tricarboxylate transporter substrate binding protein n=1 Tax=Bordetella bronchiseptica TaxID=518 RepID=UPI000290453F|nr:tripartite tricarboxylate transporter substrate binding protein [Bordetella bronchiseptica]KAK65463.1 tripartite tricarboxylate transporter family receptor [Bordetella bronchiseptica MO211]CCN16877.1 putative exported protein [Bordetella bronchiseptica MO211]